MAVEQAGTVKKKKKIVFQMSPPGLRLFRGAAPVVKEAV